MSFYFKQDVRTAEEGKAFVEKQHAPQSVKDFIATALDGLEARREDSPFDGVRIHANGHLCDSRASYEVSNAVIEVSPIRF